MNEAPETRITRSADGASLGYLVTGGGPIDLVFMGGATSGLEVMWDDPGFRRMAKRLGTFSRTIWPNPSGYGASERAVGDNLEVSDTDIEALLDAVGAEKGVLVGWSTTGGRVIHFAATHPERVSALVLIDSCAHYIQEDDYRWGIPRESLDRIVATLEDDWATGDDIRFNAPSRMADERFRAWWARIRRSSVAPTALAKAFRVTLELDVRGFLPLISAPTLVLHRAGDRYVHVGAGRYLAEHIPNAKFVLLPGDDHLYFVGDTDVLVDEIEEFLTGSRSGADADVVNATILFTDIVGSTEHQARFDPREWSRLTGEHDAMVRQVLAHHRGREVKTTGDGFLATFDATARALRCASEILVNAKGVGLDLRAGLHVGDVEVRDDDISGLPVSIAKRVCDLATPGEVLVSETVRSLMTGSQFGFRERGQHELRGVPGSWWLYRVVS